MRKANLNIYLVWLLVLVLAGPVSARIIYVDVNGPNDPGTGSYEDPFRRIQTGIDDANDDDEIEVAPGIYEESINFNGKAVWLHSSSLDFTTINGTGHRHVVQCVSGEDANTILDGFTITGGDACGVGSPFFDGGGMLNNGSSPTVTNCTFTGNAADYGGGMYNGYGSNPTVTNCIFQNNTARVWGAGMFNKLSNPTVTNCTFYNNSANWDGGGMFNELSSPTVTDCNFTENGAQQYSGGGMYSKDNSNPTLTNCTFSGNTAGLDGGGILNNLNSSPTVTNCTFSGNSANYGGGMYNLDNSAPTMTNCTFSGNLANNAGGGIINNLGSSPTVINCILWGNTPDEVNDWDTNSTTSVSYSDIEGGWGDPNDPNNNNIDADPLFVDAAGGDLRLSSDASPCVDAGDNNAPNLPATDLAGNPRVVDGDRDGTATVDMGAYELQEVLAIHNITQDIWYVSIQASINYANAGDQIEVGPGTYYEAINFKGKAVRLYSSGGPEVTTINGSGHYHVVQCVSGEDSNTVLEGFTITGGNANGASWPDDCGGGMFNDGSSPTVTDCTFSGNIANSAGGGMINNSGSSPMVTNCTFTSNQVILSPDSGGGGMSNYQSSPTVTDCIFTGNTSNVFGGGMFNYRSSLTVTNCTFSGNSANNYGGGIINGNESHPTVTNCILWGNTAPSGPQIYNVGTSSTTVTYSDIQGGWGDPNDPNNTNIDADPCFIMDTNHPDPNLWNLRLKPDSPCIDAGDTTAVYLPLDLDGYPRAIDDPHTPNTGRSVSDSLNVVDMGAYEFQPCRIAGDINCDGVVDFKDLAILCNNWLVGTEP